MKLPPPAYRYRAIIRRVIDGDTVVADVDLGCDGDRAVILVSVKDKREKFGRLLGKLLGVHGDGAEVCLNDEMVEAGYATRI